jgi:hypothetical protein
LVRQNNPERGPSDRCLLISEARPYTTQRVTATITTGIVTNPSAVDTATLAVTSS